MIAGALGTSLWRRPVCPIVTDPTALGLRLRLHGGGAGKTFIEHERVPAILGTEGIDRRERCLRIERLHGLCCVFRRHE